MGATHAALVRGINVGRAKRLAMADLRRLLTGLGYTGVRTLLNSGNAVFAVARGDRRNHGVRIERALAELLEVHASVVVLAARELDTIIAENPLSAVADSPSRLLVAIPLDAPPGATVRPLEQEAWGREALRLGSRAIYLWCPDGVLECRAAAAVGRVLGERVTIRNWATLGKLQALMQMDPP